jgi:hypothetical protein
MQLRVNVTNSAYLWKENGDVLIEEELKESKRTGLMFNERERRMHLTVLYFASTGLDAVVGNAKMYSSSSRE